MILNFTCDGGFWKWFASVNRKVKMSNRSYSSFEEAAKEAREWASSPQRWEDDDVGIESKRDERRQPRNAYRGIRRRRLSSVRHSIVPAANDGTTPIGS